MRLALTIATGGSWFSVDLADTWRSIGADNLLALPRTQCFIGPLLGPESVYVKTRTYGPPNGLSQRRRGASMAPPHLCSSKALPQQTFLVRDLRFWTLGIRASSQFRAQGFVLT